MPIYKLLQGSNEFNAADVACLTAAYESALSLARLKDRDDPLTKLIADKIIDAYRAGIRDPARICAKALEELGVPYGN